MKKTILFLLISFLFYSNMTFAQSWETVNPKPFGGDITGVSFIDGEKGFLSCDEGTILRTQDGGYYWDKYKSNVTDYFLDIKFVSESAGFIVGHNNAIGRTVNGGETWDFIQGPGESTYWKMYFADQMHGWICGWYSTLLRTQDGGISWQLLSQNIWNDRNYFCMDFLNSDTGYIAGGYGIQYSQGRLYRTINGGVSVQEIVLPAASKSITAIDVLSYNEIWLCEGHQINGESRLYHTTDAGATWQTKVIGVYTSVGSNIEFISPLKGRVTGGNFCFSTEDGGITWNQNYISTTNYSGYIRASDWINDSLAFAVGQSGYIVKSLNSVNKWQELSHGSRAAFSDIAFTNEQTGCAVGSESGNEYIYHTSDGGETWTSALNSTNYNGWICDINYYSANEVWAAGWYDRIYHSTDGGINWTTINPTGNELNQYYSLCRVSDGRIYAGGSKLIYSDDNGLNWQYNDFEYPGYVIRKVIFTDPLNGYLLLWENSYFSVFYGKMFRTHDGGNTWEDINYNPDGVTSKILAADFLNKDVGIISIYGSGISTTIDGGITWKQQAYVPYHEVYYLKMFNATDAVAVDGSGGVFYSFNGGMDWEQLELTDGLQYSGNSQEINHFLSGKKPEAPSGIDGLLGTCFTGMGSGWLCRDNGLIRKYSYLNVGTEEPVVTEPGIYKIYPNPATDIIQIVGDKRFDHIALFNSQGKCIQQYAGTVTEIDVSAWPAGVYLMQIANGRQMESLRFVKK